MSTVPKSRETRSEYLQTTFTPTERRLIEQEARREDRSVSSWLRLAALAAMRGEKTA